MYLFTAGTCRYLKVFLVRAHLMVCLENSRKAMRERSHGMEPQGFRWPQPFTVVLCSYCYTCAQEEHQQKVLVAFKSYADRMFPIMLLYFLLAASLMSVFMETCWLSGLAVLFGAVTSPQDALFLSQPPRRRCSLSLPVSNTEVADVCCSMRCAA